MRQFLDTGIRNAQDCYFFSRVFLHIIEAIQLGSLGFEAAFGWSQDALDGLHGVAILRLRLEDDLFLSVFSVLTGLVALFVFISIATTVLGLDCCEGTVDEFVWYYIGDAVLFGIMFIPLTQVTLEIFHCTNGRLVKAPDVVCWEGDHLIYVALGCVAIVALLFGSVVKASFRNHTSHDPDNRLRMRARVNYFDTKYQAYRLMAIVASVFVAAESAVASAIVLCIIALWPIAYLWRRCPHIEPKYNTIKGLLFCSVWWMFVVTMVSSVNDDPTAEWPAYLLLATPVIGFIGAFITVAFNKRKPVTPDDLGRNLELDASIPVTEGQKLAKKAHVSENKLVEITSDDDKDLFDKISGGPALREDVEVLVIRRSDDALRPKGEASLNTVRHLANVIAQQTNLRHLSFTGHNLDKVRVEALTHVLRNHPTLKSLDLFENMMDDEAAKTVVEAVITNESLKKLNIGNNVTSARGREEIKQINDRRPRLRIAM